VNLFTFLSTLINMLERGFQFLYDALVELLGGVPKKSETYHAEFVSAGSVASRWNKGFNLTGTRNLKISDSYMNAMICGGSGSGKTSVVLLPSIYSMKSSKVINDPSGELLLQSGGYLRSEGFKVIELNFLRPEISAGYNPLIRAQSSSEIQKIASMLVRGSLGTKSSDPFWTNLAITLLWILISILKKQEPQFYNLCNVRHLLNQMGSNPKAVDSLFAKDADEKLYAEYLSFISYDQKIVSGVLASCKSALQLFNDDSIAKVTSHDSISFKGFRERPTILFLRNSIPDQRYYSILTSLFFEQFFSFLLSELPSTEHQDIFLLIDEASSLYIPTLPIAVANVRKHKAGIMLLLQDYSQLANQYGEHDSKGIRSNCYAKVYFPGQTLDTSRYLEAELGQFEFEKEDGKRIVRPLMTNDEIRTMSKDRALLICGNNPPVFAHTRPFYKNAWFKRYSKIPYMPSISDHIPEVPLLPLEHNNSIKYA